MNKTEEEMFKKMCEKAEEIQENWNRLPGDCVYNRILEKIIIFNRPTSSSNYSIAYTTDGETKIMTQEEWDKNKNVWLPRQDQLQDMAWDKEYHEDNSDHLLMRFYTEIHKIPDFDWQYWGRFRTMEQKWLAFVMKSRYNKVWINDEWGEDKR